MALFPHIDTEEKIQINDLIRFDLSKSFVSKGSTAISVATVTPGVDQSAQDIYDADSEQRFLDWEFKTWNIDIDATNNKIDFTEAGTAFVATISNGTYTLSTLATEIKTQMEAVGAYTYTVTVSAVDKMTIAGSSAFALLPTTGANATVSLLPTLGFSSDDDEADSDWTAATSHTGLRIRYLTKKVTGLVGDGTDTESESVYVKVYSVDGDALFSSDSDLMAHEPDIKKWVPVGRNSFKNVHRQAQELIIAWLDERGYVDIYEDKFTIDHMTRLDEFKQWSKYKVLSLIFNGISNSVDDIFSQKSAEYESAEEPHRNRAVIRLDIDKDGSTDDYETLRLDTARIWRR